MASTAKELLKAACPTVSIGVLTADLLNLGAELNVLESAGAAVVHVDVMDGVFCPGMTVGPPLIQAIKTPLLKDVHLMISDPIAKLTGYVAAGADIVTVHVESTPHAHQALCALGKLPNVNDPERGIVRGIALCPSTSVARIEPLLDEADLVVVLAVNPGFPGQTFNPATPKRIERLKAMIGSRDVMLCVDGGVKKDNIGEVVAMGADLVVTGSAVFDGKAPAANAAFMLEAVQQ